MKTYYYRGITEEPQARPRKRNKRNNEPTTATAGAGDERPLESDKKNSILVRAYSKRGDDTHISEAEVKVDSTGNLAVEHVAEKLKLKGTLRVS